MQIFQNLNIFFPEFSIKIFSILLIKVFVSIFETNNLHIRPYLSSSIWVKTLSALFSESYVSKYPYRGTWPLLRTNYACNICVYVDYSFSFVCSIKIFFFSILQARNTSKAHTQTLTTHYQFAQTTKTHVQHAYTHIPMFAFRC